MAPHSHGHQQPATSNQQPATRMVHGPTNFDKRVRRVAQRPALDGIRTLMSPLFPLGLPGGYITMAYAAAYWLRRRGRHGGPAIVTAAWLGWLVHRAVKIGYRRERPLRPDVPRRTDSFPSGHTTGTTALASTAALVLHRERLISMPAAVAIGVGAPAIMGAYRVIADDHWTTDVFGGWMLGAAIGLACNAALGMSSSAASNAVRAAESSSRFARRHARRERFASTT